MNSSSNLCKVVPLRSKYLEQEIANILSALTFNTDEDRSKLLQTLVNSDLSVDFIRETYQPLTNKKNNSNVETKLPQKSVPDKRNDSSFVY